MFCLYFYRRMHLSAPITIFLEFERHHFVERFWTGRSVKQTRNSIGMVEWRKQPEVAFEFSMKTWCYLKEKAKHLYLCLGQTLEYKQLWCVARFWISHYLAFAWSFERMRMHANALFYLHIVFIRLHELAWHSNGSIKCQTFECHSNG